MTFRLMRVLRGTRASARLRIPLLPQASFSPPARQRLVRRPRSCETCAAPIVESSAAKHFRFHLPIFSCRIFAIGAKHPEQSASLETFPGGLSDSDRGAAAHGTT